MQEVPKQKIIETGFTTITAVVRVLSTNRGLISNELCRFCGEMEEVESEDHQV